jgi:hypothetical protein
LLDILTLGVLTNSPPVNITTQIFDAEISVLSDKGLTNKFEIDKFSFDASEDTEELPDNDSAIINNNQTNESGLPSNVVVYTNQTLKDN